MKVSIKPSKQPKIKEGCVVVIKSDDGTELPYLVVLDRYKTKYRLVNLIYCEVLSECQAHVEDIIEYYFPNKEYVVYSPDEVSMKVGVHNGQTQS